MNIIVRDNLGKDVTHEREWYINTDGKIFYYTGDIDGPLYVVDNDYTWEVVDKAEAISNSITIEEYKMDYLNANEYMFFIDRDILEKYKVDPDRIAKAIENMKKYEKR